MKIKDKLTTFFLLLGILPLLLLGGFAAISSQEAIKSQVNDFFTKSLSLISLMLETQTNTLLQAVQSLTNDMELIELLSRKTPPTEPSYLEEEKTIQLRLSSLRHQIPDIRALYIHRPQFPLIINGVPTTFEGIFFRQNPQENSLLTQVYASSPLPHWVTQLEEGRERFYIFRKWLNTISGETLGVLILSIDEKSVSSVLQRAVGESPGDIFLLDGDGKVISSYPRTPTPAFADRGLEGYDPSFLSQTKQTAQGWRLFYRIPVNAVLADTQFLGIGIAFFCGLLIVFSFALSMLVTRHITHPIDTLQKAMKQVESGEFRPAVDDRRDEFALLYRGYNGMVTRLSYLFEELNDSLKEIAAHKSEMEAYNNRLEEMVRERTNELLQAEKMASLGGLVAGVAHEINTPLGIGITSVSYLQDGLKNMQKLFDSNALKKTDLEGFLKSTSGAIDMAMLNLQKSAELVSSFKRVAVDQSREDCVHFRLSENLRDIMQSLKPRLARHAQKVSCQCPDELELHSYPGVIYQIVSNLVLNCLIHAFENPSAPGRIEIEAEGQGEKILLTVTDDGMGMTPEVKAKIFDPFFTTKRQAGGSGLGLHIVYNLVSQKLRGRIRCESEVGRGTQFAIEFPRESI